MVARPVGWLSGLETVKITPAGEGHPCRRLTFVQGLFVGGPVWYSGYGGNSCRLLYNQGQQESDDRQEEPDSHSPLLRPSHSKKAPFCFKVVWSVTAAHRSSRGAEVFARAF